eukprot:363517-Chlamydomonas_euryale.AAC.11
MQAPKAAHKPCGRQGLLANHAGAKVCTQTMRAPRAARKPCGRQDSDGGRGGEAIVAITDLATSNTPSPPGFGFSGPQLSQCGHDTVKDAAFFSTVTTPADWARPIDWPDSRNAPPVVTRVGKKVRIAFTVFGAVFSESFDVAG